MKIVSTSRDGPIDDTKMANDIKTSDDYGCIKFLIYKMRSVENHRLQFPSFLDDTRTPAQQTGPPTESNSAETGHAMADSSGNIPDDSSASTLTHKIELVPVECGGDVHALGAKLTDYKRPGKKPWATFTFHYRDRVLLERKYHGTVACSWGADVRQFAAGSRKRTWREDDEDSNGLGSAGTSSNKLPIATTGAGAAFTKRLRSELTSRDRDRCEHCGGDHAADDCFVKYLDKAPPGWKESANARHWRERWEKYHTGNKDNANITQASEPGLAEVFRRASGDGYGPGSRYRLSDTWTPGPRRNEPESAESTETKPTCASCGGRHESSACWFEHPEKVLRGWVESDNAKRLRVRFEAEKARRETLFVEDEEDDVEHCTSNSTNCSSVTDSGKAPSSTTTILAPTRLNASQMFLPPFAKPQDPRRATAISSTPVLETPTSPPDAGSTLVTPASPPQRFVETSPEMYKARVTIITMPSKIIRDNPENRKIMPMERLKKGIRIGRGGGPVTSRLK